MGDLFDALLDTLYYLYPENHDSEGHAPNMEYKYASAAFTSFRNWDVYQCDVVFRDYGDLYSEYCGGEVSWYLGSATVFEKESRKEVRKICLIGYLDIERLEKMNLSIEQIL